MECKYCGAPMYRGQRYCTECGVSPDGYIVETKLVGSWELKHKYGLSWKDVVRNGRGNYTFQKFDRCTRCGSKVSKNEYNCPVCLEPIPIRQLKRVKYRGEKSVKSRIRKEWWKNKTSICPHCGSHSIKVYRKGYSWNEAFWGSVLGVRELRYTAGMGANEAMCRCETCGCVWNSHYDIRQVK